MFENTLAELPKAAYVEETLKHNLGKLSSGGALVVETGKFTGRAADDKYIVSSAYSEKVINWKNKVGKLTRIQASTLKNEIIEALKKSPQTYTLTRSIGAHPKFRLKAKLITQHPAQAFFFENMLRPLEGHDYFQSWTIYHAPFHELSLSHGNARSTAIVIDFELSEILIAGTAYAGEVKKALFSVMNTLLLDHNVLPMHSGANIDALGNVSVFFGLSGTGKTTLSADIGRRLIGDDEHGLADDGVFNFEGGCYAKTAKLSSIDEPQIHAAATRFGALLENVKLDESRLPDFFDLSLTENGRASYPLDFISDSYPTHRGGIPKDIFFLSADAFGVLPPVASLNSSQARDFFLCGYTAKLAGTEVGVKEPKATFSYCFGAPFMMREAKEYGDLLIKHIQKHQINVWLINTGWGAGGYGVSERFPLQMTRQIIRAIQRNEVEALKGKTDPVFGFVVPENIEGVSADKLKTCDPTDQQALNLKKQFDEVLKKLNA